MAMTRKDGRSPDELRPVRIERRYSKYALGSCLFEMGDTRVICAVSCEDRVPPFLVGAGSGWVTAEYGLLPASTTTRVARSAAHSGRSQEIQRLIGRSLRGVVDLRRLGERTLWVDCDVLQADGGTRTASVTGAFIALVDALCRLRERKLISLPVLRDTIAAVSVGIVQGVPLLDLDYSEDSQAAVDCKVVMTGRGGFVEIQGTGEGAPFSRDDLEKLLALAAEGIRRLIGIVKGVIGDEAAALLGK